MVVADIVVTSDLQQDWYTDTSFNFNTAAWILVQLLSSNTPVHSINSL